MAQSDFDFNATFDTGAIVGGNDGYAVTNASLASPLTGEGTYCREFANSTTGDIAMVATLNDPQFQEISDGYSISVRAWIRSTGITTASYAVGIGAKIHGGGPDVDTNAPNGYCVLIGDTNQTAAAAFLRFVIDTGSTVTATDTSFAVSTDTWYKVRLDVIPVGTAEDIVRVYTGTGTTGSETWTLQYSRIILNSDPDYIPWNDTGNGRVGFFTVHNSNAHTHYVDRFQVFLEAV